MPAFTKKSQFLSATILSGIRVGIRVWACAKVISDFGLVGSFYGVLRFLPPFTADFLSLIWLKK